MSYQIKEIFYTLQGEGFHAGKPAVFCRFSGCNLWTGRELDRATAVCKFCDTDFVGIDGLGGGKFASAIELSDAIQVAWGDENIEHRFVVLTGGEPLLQVDASLIEELHSRHFKIAIETNGTIPVPSGIDWVCVSPKSGSTIVQKSGDEIKLVIPQAFNTSEIEKWDFTYHYVQSMDNESKIENMKTAISWCLANPRWKLSVQMHKVIGIK